MAKPKTDNMKIDLRQVSPEERERIQRVLNRRNYSFAIKTRKPFAMAWREAAHAAGLGIGAWVERVLNNAVAKK
jgi:predicted HAD superfamily phosphohydrolase YqeG